MLEAIVEIVRKHRPKFVEQNRIPVRDLFLHITLMGERQNNAAFVCSVVWRWLKVTDA